MDMKNVLWHMLWIIMFAALFLYIITLVGCAHFACETPEAMAARQGVVLECMSKHDSYGDPIKSCLVIKPGGTTVNFEYRSCP